MANKIKFKRGLKSKLPTLEAGEPAFLTDTRELFVGTGSGNVNISGQRAATYIVAASNSVHKETADYICDGTADQVEIKAAINALPSGGGKVLLLEGTYNFTDTITISKRNVTIEGMGMYSTKLSGTFSGYGMINANGYKNSGFALKNLSLNSSKSEGYLVYPSSDSVITNVCFNANIPGVVLEQIEGVCVSGCVFKENATIEVNNDATQIIISNNIFNSEIDCDPQSNDIITMLVSGNFFVNGAVGVSNNSDGNNIFVTGNLI